jgi:hypothetical protein
LINVLAKKWHDLDGTSDAGGGNYSTKTSITTLGTPESVQSTLGVRPDPLGSGLSVKALRIDKVRLAGSKWNYGLEYDPYLPNAVI